jgi:multicomponent Na+:H+ antiporter subunit E
MRVFFSNVISLLPGSLGAGFEGDCLKVHWIDQEQPILERLRKEEERVATLFGITLPSHTHEDSHG